MGMIQGKKKPLHLGRSAIVGMRMGAFFVGLAAVAALAVYIWQTVQAHTGRPGWELTVAPALALAFYTGWTFHAERTRKRRIQRRKEAAMRYAKSQKKTASEEDGLHDRNSIAP